MFHSNKQILFCTKKMPLTLFLLILVSFELEVPKYVTSPPIYLHWIFAILQFEILSMFQTIQGRKLFKGGNYLQKYGSLKYQGSKIQKPSLEIHFVGLGWNRVVKNVLSK